MQIIKQNKKSRTITNSKVMKKTIISIWIFPNILIKHNHCSKLNDLLKQSMHLLNTTVLKAKNIILFRKSVSLELKLHLFEFCLENGEDIYFVNMLFYLIEEVIGTILCCLTKQSKDTKSRSIGQLLKLCHDFCKSNYVELSRYINMFILNTSLGIASFYLSWTFMVYCFKGIQYK